MKQLTTVVHPMYKSIPDSLDGANLQYIVIVYQREC